MRGVVFLGEKGLELREFADPTPEAGEVVLEMKASGMCGSDLVKRYRISKSQVGEPVIAGHEPCGIVVAIGPGVSENQAYDGMRAMVHHYRGCGVCKHCRVGWPQMCLNGHLTYGITAHGGHAKYMKVPAITLVPLPEELSFEVGAAISCGTGTAYGALRRIGLSGCETIAIVGQGPVGLSATQMAKVMGARVIALDVSEPRLLLAKEFGADVTINPKKDDPVMAIKELTHGEGTELALDCSGSAEGRLAAVRATRTWGKILLVGEGGQLTVDVSSDLLRRQLTLVSSWTFSTAGQMECAQFVADRRIPVEKIFTQRYRLEEAEKAYREFDTQSTGKGVFML